MGTPDSVTNRGAERVREFLKGDYSFAECGAAALDLADREGFCGLGGTSLFQGIFENIVDTAFSVIMLGVVS